MVSGLNADLRKIPITSSLNCLIAACDRRWFFLSNMFSNKQHDARSTILLVLICGIERDKAGSGQRIFAKKKGAEKFGPLKIRLTRR